MTTRTLQHLPIIKFIDALQRATDLTKLAFIAVNQIQVLCQCDHAFLWLTTPKLRLKAVSGIANTDEHGRYLKQLTKLVANHLQTTQEAISVIDLNTVAETQPASQQLSLGAHVICCQLRSPQNELVGVLVINQKTAITNPTDLHSTLALACQQMGYCIFALRGRQPIAWQKLKRSRQVYLAALTVLLFIGLLCLPVEQRVNTTATLENQSTTTNQLEIWLPAPRAIHLTPGNRAIYYPNSQPLHPLNARITAIDYFPQSICGQHIYHLHAQLSRNIKTASFNNQGQVKLFGDRMSIARYLFAKPIAAIRQALGI